MIEIAIQDIKKYDMVQILQKAEQGEKVILVHNGTEFDIMPSQKQSNCERESAFDEFFSKMKGRLPADYKFDREEVYDRPKCFLTDN